MTSKGTGKPSKSSKSSKKAEKNSAEENKRKFREALEAKQGRTGEAHLDGGQEQEHVQPHGPVDAKRVYRRKTG
jgi:hypothetical protein